jgi:hypothetical protein
MDLSPGRRMAPSMLFAGRMVIIATVLGALSEAPTFRVASQD